MKKHFVTFYSPGTFFNEESTYPIDAWDVEKAKIMAASVKERYNATPFGFQFSTRERSDKDLDSKATKRSNMYFLGGEIESLEQVKARGANVLVMSMEGDGWSHVITNKNSWQITQPFKPGDVVLQWP
jgi:hypothetical protein